MDIIFILIEPAVPGNVGASARAINTMGFNDMRLVVPCDHLSEEARMFAHGSHHILENATVYTSFSESVKDIDFIIGTTAKKRSSKEEYIDCKELTGLLEKKGGTIEKVGLVFGREESGLTNDELGQCDLATYIPMADPYPSLNLSQAVMVYAFLLADIKLKSISHKDSKPDEEGLKQLKSKVVNLLVDIEINKNPVLFSRILERIMLLEEDDIHLFHSVLNKLEGKIGQ
ncbi:MAG: tRNA/rRNA methyltransferase [Bacteroidales bacterium]|nr:tRNA/rRNA methyltransferase [Bacteroidales bacterium]